MSVLKDEKSLEEYIEDLTERFATGDPGWQLQTRTDTQVGGHEAITIEYRFGGMGRYGTATAVNNGDYLFVFNLTAGSFCDPPGMPGLEPGAYLHMIETFQFVEQGSEGRARQAHWN
ncbi:MAG: hypothetical protein A2W36_03700 [Chloroflexi bacterium RBG_16_58_14]|nr:MAG: hypothetical protein A2W36_03700 [Chloroflexi bacterium RBG_16_58_14]